MLCGVRPCRVCLEAPLIASASRVAVQCSYLHRYNVHMHAIEGSQTLLNAKYRTCASGVTLVSVTYFK